MLTDDRCQQIMESKDDWPDVDIHPTEGWARIDNVIVIYDHEDPPAWLAAILESRDEDGNTDDPLDLNPLEP